MARKKGGLPKNLEARLGKVESFLDGQMRRIELEKKLRELGEVSLGGTVWARYDGGVDLGFFSGHLASKGLPHLLLKDTRTSHAKYELYVPAAFADLAKAYQIQFYGKLSAAEADRRRSEDEQAERDALVADMERAGYKL